MLFLEMNSAIPGTVNAIRPCSGEYTKPLKIKLARTGRLEEFAHALSADVGPVESMPVTLLWMRPELSWEQSLSSQTLRDDK